MRTIAIIGGGIASAFLAFELLNKRKDLDITLYCEGDDLADGASGNEQGAVYPHLQGSQSTLAQISALSFEYAIPYYQTLQSQLPSQFNIEFCGVLQQAHTPELEQRLQKVNAVWPQISCYVDAKTSSSLAGLSLPYSSLWFEKGCWLSPKQLTRSLHHHLKDSKGLRIKTQKTVNELRKVGNEWLLDCIDNTSSKYDSVVVCGGFKSAEFEQTNYLPIEPIRGQVSQFRSDTQFCSLKTVLCHKGYATPGCGDVQSFGATFQKNDVNTDTRPVDNQTNLQQLQSVYSEQGWSQSLSDKDILRAKAGIRGNSPDHCPMVGEVFSPKWIAQHVDKNTGQFKAEQAASSELKGLYVLSGLGARGLTTGPLMAKQLASIMLDNEFELEAELSRGISPSRFLVRALKRTKGRHEWFGGE